VLIIKVVLGEVLGVSVEDATLELGRPAGGCIDWRVSEDCWLASSEALRIDLVDCNEGEEEEEGEL
jgi:hypothetical protein